MDDREEREFAEMMKQYCIEGGELLLRETSG